MNANAPFPIDIQLVQLVRKFALLIVVGVGIVFAVMTDSIWPAHSIIRESIEIVGLLLIIICIVGRIYCTLYIGGKKSKELIIYGPYSVCRNPLYFFSIIGAAGIGAQQGSVTLAIGTGLIVYCIFRLVIFKEEGFLGSRFGREFGAYVERVPRLFPKLSFWKDADGPIEFSPSLARATAFDASIILVWLPIAEILEHLHDSGVVPVLLRLP